MLIIEWHIPLHSIFPDALRLRRGIAKSIYVRHEELKNIAPTFFKGRIAGGSPRTFDLGNFRQAAAIVSGRRRVGAAMNEGHMIGIAVVIDALKEIARPDFR